MDFKSERTATPEAIAKTSAEVNMTQNKPKKIKLDRESVLMRLAELDKEREYMEAILRNLQDEIAGDLFVFEEAEIAMIRHNTQVMQKDLLRHIEPLCTQFQETNSTGAIQNALVTWDDTAEKIEKGVTALQRLLSDSISEEESE